MATSACVHGASGAGTASTSWMSVPAAPATGASVRTWSMVSAVTAPRASQGRSARWTSTYASQAPARTGPSATTWRGTTTAPARMTWAARIALSLGRPVLAGPAGWSMAAGLRQGPGWLAWAPLACAAPTDTASASPGATSLVSATAASRAPTATRTSTTAWASRAATGAPASTRWTPSAASAPVAGRASSVTPPRSLLRPGQRLLLHVRRWLEGQDLPFA